MIFSLLLGLAILMVNKQALGGVFMLNQDTWGKEEQCKELIVQHLLTFGKSQFDPELVRDCITFLQNENLEHHDKYPIGGITSENEQMKTITTKPVSGNTLTIIDEKFEESEITGKNIQEDFQRTSDSKNSVEKLKDPSSSEDLKPTPPEDDDVVEMYPENIIQEWPAVEMVRKKRDSGVEENPGLKSTIKEDTEVRENITPQDGLEKHIQKDSQATSESEESPEKPKYPYLGKDYKPPPPKDDLVDIYPEKPLPEWPEIEMTRKKRETGNQESTNKEDEAYVSPGRPSLELHTPRDDMELDQRTSPGKVTRQKATRVRATTKKVDPVVLPGPPSWEKHTLKYDLELDERSRNRPQTKIQLLIFYFERFINWFKARFGLGPKVIQV